MDYIKFIKLLNVSKDFQFFAIIFFLIAQVFSA